MVAATLDCSSGSARFHCDDPRYGSPADAEGEEVPAPCARRKGLRQEERKEVLP